MNENICLLRFWMRKFLSHHNYQLLLICKCVLESQGPLRDLQKCFRMLRVVTTICIYIYVLSGFFCKFVSETWKIYHFIAFKRLLFLFENIFFKNFNIKNTKCFPIFSFLWTENNCSEIKSKHNLFFVFKNYYSK